MHRDCLDAYPCGMRVDGDAGFGMVGNVLRAGDRHQRPTEERGRSSLLLPPRAHLPRPIPTLIPRTPATVRLGSPPSVSFAPSHHTHSTW